MTTGTLFVDTKLSAGPAQKLHALDVTTGAEKFGGPVTVTANLFDASVEHQRPGLLLLNGVAFDARWSTAVFTSIIVGVFILSMVVLTGFAGQLSLAQYAMS